MADCISAYNCIQLHTTAFHINVQVFTSSEGTFISIRDRSMFAPYQVHTKSSMMLKPGTGENKLLMCSFYNINEQDIRNYNLIDSSISKQNHRIIDFQR